MLFSLMKRNEKKKVEVLFEVAVRHELHSERQPRWQEGFVSMTTSERVAKRGRTGMFHAGAQVTLLAGTVSFMDLS